MYKANKKVYPYLRSVDNISQICAEGGPRYLEQIEYCWYSLIRTYVKTTMSDNRIAHGVAYTPFSKEIYARYVETGLATITEINETLIQNGDWNSFLKEVRLFLLGGEDPLSEIPIFNGSGKQLAYAMYKMGKELFPDESNSELKITDSLWRKNNYTVLPWSSNLISPSYARESIGLSRDASWGEFKEMVLSYGNPINDNLGENNE